MENKRPTLSEMIKNYANMIDAIDFCNINLNCLDNGEGLMDGNLCKTVKNGIVTPKVCPLFDNSRYISRGLNGIADEVAKLEAREVQEASFDSYTVDGVKTRVVLEKGEE
ncbi:hypothetical protein [Christensenella hongkongensis]|uniref:hypothetical protein n=1 Tax=Christensenella hongkongensis TaxID=270498 RepID=UPI00267178A4|nr:hypothetical protein [Christensenella hongkongensis]